MSNSLKYLGCSINFQNVGSSPNFSDYQIRSVAKIQGAIFMKYTYPEVHLTI